MSAPASVLAVDLGKTRCRVRWRRDGQPATSAEGHGALGLAETGGAMAAAAAVRTTVAALAGADGCGRGVDAGGLEVGPGRLASRLGPGRLAVGIGAAGAAAAPAAAVELARLLARELPGARIAVTSDAVAAHAGAFGGGPGVVLAAGTGAVAAAISPTGRCRLVDGWGQWLGDEGSGAWLGREGLRAVLRARDGRGPATALTARASEGYGDLATLPAAVAAEGNPARTTAAFAPDVLAAAETGDAVAQRLVAEAGAALADTALAAARHAACGMTRPVPVAFVGGLSHAGAALLGPWRTALEAGARAAGLEVEIRPALGSPLDGAALLAERVDLPHETQVSRLADPSHAPAVASSMPDLDAGLDALPTEVRRPGLQDLDSRGPAELVDLLLDAEAALPIALEVARPALAALVAGVAERLESGGRLCYVGAGTPGRLAALDAAECVPTFGVEPGLVIAVMAGGTAALVRALEGVEDDADAGGADVEAHGIGPRDAVVGISASGRTPYVLGALAAARAAGALTGAVVNNAGTPAASAADLAVEVLTGPEILAGSTRLTAATAQKVVLNTISTAVMVRLGKTYAGHMVDVQVTNHKLHRRAVRILRDLTGADDATAQAALADADCRVKPAVVALLAGVTPAEARRRLDAAGGHVRAALAHE
jgi:N-acetylmuramic acid 6-phosphate etherase